MIWKQWEHHNLKAKTITSQPEGKENTRIWKQRDHHNLKQWKRTPHKENTMIWKQREHHDLKATERRSFKNESITASQQGVDSHAGFTSNPSKFTCHGKGQLGRVLAGTARELVDSLYSHPHPPFLAMPFAAKIINITHVWNPIKSPCSTNAGLCRLPHSKKDWFQFTEGSVLLFFNVRIWSQCGLCTRRKVRHYTTLV